MSTEITTSKTFQEKMFERIRDQIGDLMTEEDLKKIVEVAMQKAFFEPVTEIGRYGDKTTTDPIFVKKIRSLMEEQVKLQVSAWIKEHPEEITKTLNECIGKGMSGMMIAHFDSKLSYPLQQFAEGLRQKGLL
jgi:hypothetical protein